MASANFATVEHSTRSQKFFKKQDLPPPGYPVIIVVKVSHSYSTLDYLIIVKFGLATFWL